MRILVTSGTGFIGHFLCRRLLADGISVTVLSRQPAKVAGSFGHQIAALESPLLPSTVTVFDAVVNLAGAPIFGPRWTSHRKQALLDSRVAFTEQLVGSIAHANQPPTVLLSGSAIGYYGHHGEDAIDEMCPAVNGFAHQRCASWERAAHRAIECEVRVCTCGPV